MENEQVETIRARHTRVDCQLYNNLNIKQECNVCHQLWPCDTIQLADEYDSVREQLKTAMETGEFLLKTQAGQYAKERSALREERDRLKLELQVGRDLMVLLQNQLQQAERDRDAAVKALKEKHPSLYYMKVSEELQKENTTFKQRLAAAEQRVREVEKLECKDFVEEYAEKMTDITVTGLEKSSHGDLVTRCLRLITTIGRRDAEIKAHEQAQEQSERTVAELRAQLAGKSITQYDADQETIAALTARVDALRSSITELLCWLPQSMTPEQAGAKCHTMHDAIIKAQQALEAHDAGR